MPKRTPQQQGKSSRNKGHNFERWVAKELREVFPEAKRGFQTRGGTAEQPDVMGCGPFAIECKAHKKVDRKAAYAQALCGVIAAGSEATPIAVCKDDRQKPVVVISLGDLAHLLTGRSSDGDAYEATAEVLFEDFKALLKRTQGGAAE